MTHDSTLEGRQASTFEEEINQASQSGGSNGGGGDASRVKPIRTHSSVIGQGAPGVFDVDLAPLGGTFSGIVTDDFDKPLTGIGNVGTNAGLGSPTFPISMTGQIPFSNVSYLGAPQMVLTAGPFTTGISTFNLNLNISAPSPEIYSSYVNTPTIFDSITFDLGQFKTSFTAAPLQISLNNLIVPVVPGSYPYGDESGSFAYTPAFTPGALGPAAQKFGFRPRVKQVGFMGMSSGTFNISATFNAPADGTTNGLGAMKVELYSVSTTGFNTL